MHTYPYVYLYSFIVYISVWCKTIPGMILQGGRGIVVLDLATRLLPEQLSDGVRGPCNNTNVPSGYVKIAIENGDFP